MQEGLPIFSCTVAVATGAAGATRQDSLDGINTAQLTDGTFAWVQSGPAALTLFRLDVGSAAAPDGTTIVAPLSGPGRWLAFAGGSSGSGMVVADTINNGGTELAAIDTTGIADGTLAWVRSVEDLFVLNRTTALVTDNLTIVAGFTGGGQWLRRNNGSQRWLLQTDWFIDSANGNDENDGNTAGTALRTHSELERRWGPDPILGRPGEAGTTIFTVNILDNLDENTDRTPYISVTLRGQDILHYVGRATATLHSGTLTGFTATDPATNVQASIDDAAVGDWDTAGPGGTSLIGFRIRLTATGATTFLAKRNTATNARVGQFMTVAPTPPQTTDQVTPVGNEAYVVESLTSMNNPKFHIRRSAFDPGAAGNIFGLVVQDMAFGSDGGSENHSLSVDGDTLGVGAMIAQSDVYTPLIRGSVPTSVGLVLTACGLKPDPGFGPLLFWISYGGRLAVQDSVVFETPVIIPGVDVTLLGNNLVQSPAGGAGFIGSLVVRNNAQLNYEGNVGIFDSQAFGLWIGGSVEQNSDTGGRIYGDGHLTGISVQRGGRLLYTGAPEAPTITGSTNQFELIFDDFATAADLPIAKMWGGIIQRSAAAVPGETIQRGIATLSGGTVTVGPAGAGERILLRATSRIMLTVNTPGGTPGFLSAPAASRITGARGTGQFVINSTNGADTSTIDWEIID